MIYKMFSLQNGRKKNMDYISQKHLNIIEESNRFIKIICCINRSEKYIWKFNENRPDIICLKCLWREINRAINIEEFH